MIFGIFNKKRLSVDTDLVESVKDEIARLNPDNLGYSIMNHVALGAATLNTTSQMSQSSLPFLYSKSNCTITFSGRLDYREELANKIGQSGPVIEDMTDSQLLLLSYLYFGEKCTNHLYGDFVFAIWDGNKQLLFCGRDHFGCIPFLYYDSQEYFLFSSDIKSIVGFPGAPKTIKNESVIDSILGIYPSKDSSPFPNVKKLLPAYTLSISIGKPIILKKYWDLKKQVIRLKNEKFAITELQSKFQTAIHERCSNLKSIGIELSGGLDSSSITAVAIDLSRKMNQELFTFTHSILNSKLKSESEIRNQANLIRKIENIQLINKQVFIYGENDAKLLNALKDSVMLMQSPIFNTIGSLSFQLLNKVNENGIKVLLSGFGGDEVVTSGADGIFNELAQQMKLRRLSKQLSWKIRIYGGNFIKSFIKILFFSWMPGMVFFRRLYHRHFGIENKYFRAIPLSSYFKKQKKIRVKYFKETSPLFDNNISLRQYKRIMHRYVPSRLEGSYYHAFERKIEYRYPFLDVKLIEFYYSLPSEMKHKDGFGRWVFRKAMEEFLPSEICWHKRKEDPMIPYILPKFEIEIDSFKAIINESRKENRFHYIDYIETNRIADQLLKKANGISVYARNPVFFNSICILILQKWQREGKIDIGIKC